MEGANRQTSDDKTLLLQIQGLTISRWSTISNRDTQVHKVQILQQTQIVNTTEHKGRHFRIHTYSVSQVEQKSGNIGVITVVDSWIKWCEAFPLPNQEAVTVADCLVTEVFLRFGVPKTLHTDRGPEFTSNLIKEICRLFQVDITTKTPYRPQSDGLAERMNRNTIDLLSKFVSEHLDDLDEHLPYIMAAYRATVQESTKCTPNLLMLGREINMPIDLIYPLPRNQEMPCQIEYVDWVQRAMLDNFELVRENLKASQMRQKQ